MKKIFLLLVLSGFAWANYSWLINHKMNKLGIYGFEERMNFSMQEMSKISNDPSHVDFLMFEYDKDMCETTNDLNSCNKTGVYQYKKGYYKSAATWFEYTCDKNDKTGCGNLGDTYEKLNQQQKANKAYEKGCNLNESRSCNNIGWAYENKLGVKLDYKKALAYYKKACELGSGAGCNNIGWIYQNAKGVKKNTKTAKQYYKNACDFGSKTGCNNYKNIK